MVAPVVTRSSSPIATAKAFCPGHITGFLGKVPKINNNNNNYGSNNYLYLGSLGAGLAIDHGILTSVKVFDKNKNNNDNNQSKSDYQISINELMYSNDNNNNTEVSESVAQKYLKLIPTEHQQQQPPPQYYIEIKHKTTIPIGYGLASSGAAALSLSYALNDALKVGLNIEQAAQIAHCSEIECKTGLGSVIAQYIGGFELRSAIGAPGVGMIEKIALADYKIIILCISPISTKSYLTKYIDIINGTGEKMLERLKISKDIDEFLNMSYDFAFNLGLIQGKTKAAILRLRSLGFNCSVALFGETVFTVVPSYEVNEVIKCLKSFGGILLVCNIDNEGARVIQ